MIYNNVADPCEVYIPLAANKFIIHVIYDLLFPRGGHAHS